MTAEKPEGDVALLCHWLRKHTESFVPIPFAAERAIIVLESQATRIATLSEALREITDHFADVMRGPLVAGRGVNFANGIEGIPTIARARRALSAGQGEAK